MARKGIKKEDREDLEWEGLMRLIEGIVLHVLDVVSISGKWYPRHISMHTLLAKKNSIRDMQKWMRGWQWDTWLNIYTDSNNYSSNLIKKKFNNISRASIRYINQRIHEEEAKNTKVQNTTKKSI